MSIDVNVQNDLVIVTESSEDITVNVSNAPGADGVGVPVGGTTGQVLKKFSNTNYDTYWALDGGGVPYSGATGQVDLGNYDLKVQGLTIGKGNNSLVNNTALGHSTLLTATTGNFNTAVGYESLRNTTTGQYNTAVGQSSLFSNTTGGQNTALGLNALLSNTTASSNVAVGLDSLQHITTGSSNTAIGYNAGTHITGGSTPNTTATNSVFIGRDSKANADGQTNQIVIGQNAVGNGSNTATFGNTATTANYFTGSINGGSFVKSGGTSSQFLKADGSVDSTTYVGGSGTSGQVAYWNGTSSQTGSNNLFWDAANSRLGINTTSPIRALDIRGAARIETASTTELDLIGGGGNILRVSCSATTPFIGTMTSNPLGFFIGATERARFFTTGNFGINTGATDGGQRLQVMGDAFIKGSGTSSDAIVIQNSAGSAVFAVRGDTRLTLGGKIDIGLTNTAFNAYSNSLNILGIIPSASWTSEGTGVWVFDRAASSTSGALRQIRFGGIGSGFAPTSGTATHTHLEINSTINQTGGANGITRGLYVNPTLTAAADWRSIEWSNNSGWGLYGAGTANNYLGGSLGIGTTSPIGKIETFNNSIYIGGALSMYSNTASDESIFYFRRGRGTLASPTTVSNGDTIGSIRFAVQYNSSVGGYNTNAKIDSIVESSGANLCFYTNSGGIANSTIAERMRLTAAGRLLLGTTTESTFLLDVNGTARVSGAMTIKGTTNNDTTVILQVSQANGNGRFAVSANAQTIIAGDSFQSTENLVTITRNAFNPTSGTATHTSLFVNPTINQTGGANGITRGLYIAPTLTAAADWRAIEVSAGVSVLAPSTTASATLRIPSGTAPTSPVNGDIWFDGTDLKMRIGGVTKTFTLV